MDCKIADDRLRGVKAIAEEMGETERQVRYGIDTGRIPRLKKAACGALRARYCGRNAWGPNTRPPEKCARTRSLPGRGALQPTARR